MFKTRTCHPSQASAAAKHSSAGMSVWRTAEMSVHTKRVFLAVVKRVSPISLQNLPSNCLPACLPARLPAAGIALQCRRRLQGVGKASHLAEYHHPAARVENKLDGASKCIFHDASYNFKYRVRVE